MIKTNKTIFIAGGGTGGHLFPAITIGEALKIKGMEIYYIGSKHGIEKEFFTKNNLRYYLLDIKGIQRDISFKSIINNLIFPIKFILSYYSSIKLIKKHKPAAIIGTGGYCSGLPLIAGLKLRIPTFIQDQNSIPGLITRKLYKKVTKVFSGYKSQVKLLKTNCLFSGNPIRKELNIINKDFAKKNINFNTNKKLIFIIGGSQGAHPINMHFYNNLDFYLNKDFQILWQCGNYDYEFLKSKINNNNIIIKNFIHNMSESYSAADIVISRAGALAISELTYMGKAMVLIPFPQAAENHQYLNAKYIEENNACKLIQQNELISGNLENFIHKIFNDKKNITNLESESKKISKPDSINIITNEILNHI